MRLLSLSLFLSITTLLIGLWYLEHHYNQLNFKNQAGQNGTWITVPEGEIFTQSFGQRDTRPVLLFETGIGGFSNLAKPLLEELSRDFFVISYDRMSYGLSSALQLPFSLAQNRRHTQAVLQHYEVTSPFIYAGYSLGAMYARDFSHHHPDSIRCLVFLDPAIPAELAPKRQQKVFHLHANWQDHYDLSRAWLGYFRLRFYLGRLRRPETLALWEHSKSYGHKRSAMFERHNLWPLSHQVAWHTPQTQTQTLMLTGLRGIAATDDRQQRNQNYVDHHPGSIHRVFASLDHQDFLAPQHSEALAQEIAGFLRQGYCDQKDEL